MRLVLNTLLARLCFVYNIIVFNKHLGAKNVTKQDYDKIKASTPHYDKYMLFKLLIIHILRIFIIIVTCGNHHMLLTYSI